MKKNKQHETSDNNQSSVCTSMHMEGSMCMTCKTNIISSEDDEEWEAYCAEMRRREREEEAHYADYEREVVLQCDTYEGCEW
jgi:hypothetical protein